MTGVRHAVVIERYLLTEIGVGYRLAAE